MAELNIETALNSIENTNLKSVILHLLDNLAKKDEKIIHLSNRITDLEGRVTELEKYSSKDCIIFNNLPIQKSSIPLQQQVCQFLKDYLNFNTSPESFKACHVLGPWNNDRFPPSVIVKFVYFAEKNEIYGRKSWLANKQNHLNGKTIYMNERLPPNQLAIKKYADEKGLVTTSLNCNIKVFTKNGDKFQPVIVNSLRAVDDIQPTAVRRATNKQTQPKPSYGGTPKPDSQLAQNGKRMRSSPGENNNVIKTARIRDDEQGNVAEAN